MKRDWKFESHSPACPLCNSPEVPVFWEDRKRPYQCCVCCSLIFVPRAYHLSREEEKACYDRHQNDPDDPRYRRFLSRLYEPMMAKIRPGMQGLDYGSGPGPTLSLMFRETGFEMDNYDPFYATNSSVLDRQYHFLTASETVEHFCFPREDLQKMWELVKPGGFLGLMTKRVIDLAVFPNWHYKNEPTHVSFFSEKTFLWLSQQWNSPATFFGKDVVIFDK